MKEQWKSIKGYEGRYEVSSSGRVRSLKSIWIRKNGRQCSKKEMTLKNSKHNTGYLCVCLMKNCKGKVIQIHHLVWDVFGYKPRNKRLLQVDHIDNNKFNNRIDNLQLLTNRENTTKSSLRYEHTSKYTGVNWHTIGKKWRASIKINKKYKHLGLFIKEYDAHLAYQKALKDINKQSLGIGFHVKESGNKIINNKKIRVIKDLELLEVSIKS